MRRQRILKRRDDALTDPETQVHQDADPAARAQAELHVAARDHRHEGLDHERKASLPATKKTKKKKVK